MSSRRDPLRSQPFTPTTIRDAQDTHDTTRYLQPSGGRIPRRVGHMASGQQSPQYPAHPSVRIPQKAKAMPMGAGVAPRPTKGSPATYSQDKAPRQRAANTPNTSKSAWDASHDQNSLVMHSPPPIPPSSSSRRYNMTQSYVSSVGGADSPPMRTTFPLRESHYPEDDSPRAAYPSSRLMPQAEFPTPDNRATMQTVDSYDQFSTPRHKPGPIDTSLRPATMAKPGEISPASTRANAMNALSQAIAVGINQQSKPVSPLTMSRRTSRPFSPPVRMPFDDDMNSIHTTNEDLEPPDLKDAPPVPTSKHNVRGLASSPTSGTSEAPILGLGIGAPGRGLSTKRGTSKRPPRLDIDAVRDMEARGSTTSLTDLIKRATRLASNLDRGKTASRLGMLDMFGKSNEKLGSLPPGKRDSSMSDMLSAFPAPAIGTPRSEWPGNEKGMNASTSALPRFPSDSSSDGSNKKAGRRRICGMSVPCFTVIVIILILLIAAAVLIPIFLIVVPRQSGNNSSPASVADCTRTNKCENSGTAIFTNNACGCICSGGFTGATCATPGDSGCTTQNLQDGSVIYRDATLGQQTLQAFNDAGTFRIPLNATTILAQFSANNVPCREENDLLDMSDAINGTASTTSNNAAKRETAPEPFVMLKGYEPAPLPVHPHRVDHIQHEAAQPMITAIPTPSVALRARQDASESNTMISEINGIVFDTARNTVVTTATSATASAAAPSATGTSSSDAPPSAQLTSQLSFSRVVVLYILDKSQSLATALDAKNRLAKYFESVGSGNEVQVGMVAGLMVTADMQNLILKDGDEVVNKSD
ncbi:uncharacterized protein AB675_6420 [Cyphellophora attinorum]|uniref:EGF-like domain-containing protein n=1 Tax=Cyphellophora attinorum TaxID=1664694 RepID=A0A0N1HFI6_9EURO|nr:uncharacterized protein AB675_6420 [Phialophora attinorum]KPI44082.1 hypothetical protein AB675_6420 [Phialophora attinorum]